MWIKNARSMFNTDTACGIYISVVGISGNNCGICIDIGDENSYYIASELKLEVTEWLFNKIADALANDVKLFDVAVVLKEYDAGNSD